MLFNKDSRIHSLRSDLKSIDHSKMKRTKPAGDASVAYQKWERPPDALSTSVSKTVNFLDNMISNMEAIQGQNYVKRKPKYLYLVKPP